MREAREGKHAPRTDAARGVHRRSPRGLRLEGPRRLEKDRAVVVTAEVQRLEGGQLAETTRSDRRRILRAPAHERSSPRAPRPARDLSGSPRAASRAPRPTMRRSPSLRARRVAPGPTRACPALGSPRLEASSRIAVPSPMNATAGARHRLALPERRPLGYLRGRAEAKEQDAQGGGRRVGLLQPRRVVT